MNENPSNKETENKPCEFLGIKHDENEGSICEGCFWAKCNKNYLKPEEEKCIGCLALPIIWKHLDYTFSGIEKKGN